jgi:Ca-activated chloride channel family protein
MQVNLRKVCFALIAIATSFTSSYSQKQPEDKTLAPYFFVQGDPNVDHLPLKDTQVEIAVSGVIADVKVVQKYRNEGLRPINATYVFPASTRAAVYAMRMKIGNDIIVAKIKEKEQAKKDFEKAKEEGKSASLLEQDRPNVFTMRLANVMPQEQVEIELHYTELLVPTDGTYEVVFPTVVGPRYASPNNSEKGNGFVQTPYLRQGEKPPSTLHISAKISGGVPIQELSSPSHQVFPQYQGPNVAQLTLDDSDTFQGNRDFVLLEVLQVPSF